MRSRPCPRHAGDTRRCRRNETTSQSSALSVRLAETRYPSLVVKAQTCHRFCSPLSGPHRRQPFRCIDPKRRDANLFSLAAYLTLFTELLLLNSSTICLLDVQDSTQQSITLERSAGLEKARPASSSLPNPSALHASDLFLAFPEADARTKCNDTTPCLSSSASARSCKILMTNSSWVRSRLALGESAFLLLEVDSLWLSRLLHVGSRLALGKSASRLLLFTHVLRHADSHVSHLSFHRDSILERRNEKPTRFG